MAWRVADTEAVLLHADSSAYFGLNRSATRLWATLAEQPLTEAQLTAWARQAFLDPPPGLPAEVSAFLERLVELRLVERVEPEAAGAPNPLAGQQPAPEAWEAPAVELFGELEKLILSGE